MTKEVRSQLDHLRSKDPRDQQLQVLLCAIRRFPEKICETQVVEEGEVEEGGDVDCVDAPGVSHVSIAVRSKSNMTYQGCLNHTVRSVNNEQLLDLQVVRTHLKHWLGNFGYVPSVVSMTASGPYWILIFQPLVTSNRVM